MRAYTVAGRFRFTSQVCVRCEEINISGGMVRQKMKYERFLNKRMNTNPRRAAYKFRAPSRILVRTVRGWVHFNHTTIIHLLYCSCGTTLDDRAGLLDLEEDLGCYQPGHAPGPCMRGCTQAPSLTTS